MEGSPPNAVSCFQHPFDSLSVDMPGSPSPHASSSTLQLQDIRQEDGKPDAKDPKSWTESCRLNSDFRFLGGWVTVKITDRRGEGRRGGEGSSVDVRIFCEKMWLKEWTEKHPTAPGGKKKRGGSAFVSEGTECMKAWVQKWWEFIHLVTCNFSQSESLRILFLWKALQAVLWLTWFLVATSGELLVTLLSREILLNPISSFWCFSHAPDLFWFCLCDG